jgi:hypothetical protein
MASSCSILSPAIILCFVFFLLALSISPVLSSLSPTTNSTASGTSTDSTTLHAREDYLKYKRIRAKLRKFNKTPVKTIQAFSRTISLIMGFIFLIHFSFSFSVD